ncbi:fumarylacetoacetate hydrolase family protein [Photobacterium sp. DNB22_13_2]
MEKMFKGKVVCVALNDSEQRQLMAEQFNEPPYKAPPTQPVLYFKPRNTWSNESKAVAWPAHSDEFVVGASLAVIIGQQCRRVTSQKALDYVEGVALLHDFSLPETSYYRPDIKGKCLDGSATLSSPVTLSDAGDLSSLAVSTMVNGQQVQQLPLSRLYWDVPALLERISHIMTLEAGDIVAVGFAGERIALQPYDKVSSTVGESSTAGESSTTGLLVSLQNTVGGQYA